MISQIDVASFGSFSGLLWKNAMRNGGGSVHDFKRLNILYGRNYSGKTTLSRIFRALETGRIPANYLAPNFVVRGEEGEVNQAGIAGHGYDIRVYNRDFVIENLSFLVNQDIGGEIKSFAIVGEKNKEIEEQIAANQARLGSVEAKAGLRYDLDVRKKERDRMQSNHKIAHEGLEGKLRYHANEKIKKNQIYASVVYNIEGIKKDIAIVKKPGFAPLATDEVAVKIGLLKQEALPDITETVSISLKIGSIGRDCQEFCVRA